jgi:hypothetical protein
MIADWNRLTFVILGYLLCVISRAPIESASAGMPILLCSHQARGLETGLTLFI